MDQNALKFASPKVINQLKRLAASAKRVGFSYKIIYRSSLPTRGLARIKFYGTTTTTTNERELVALGFNKLIAAGSGVISWVAYVDEDGVVGKPQAE